MTRYLGPGDRYYYYQYYQLPQQRVELAPVQKKPRLMERINMVETFYNSDIQSDYQKRRIHPCIHPSPRPCDPVDILASLFSRQLHISSNNGRNFEYPSLRESIRPNHIFAKMTAERQETRREHYQLLQNRKVTHPQGSKRQRSQLVGKDLSEVLRPAKKPRCDLSIQEERMHLPTRKRAREVETIPEPKRVRRDMQLTS